jgi:hypothetical protein
MRNRLLGIAMIGACIYGAYWLQEQIESGRLSPFNIARAQKGQIMMGLGALTGVFLAVKNVKYKERDEDKFEDLEDY